MCQVAYMVSKFPKNRVVGMAGVLDTRALPHLHRAGTERVGGERHGGGDGRPRRHHGAGGAPVSNVSGIPLTELMDQATIDRIVDRTRNGGAEIVKYLKTGSAYYAPSAAAVEMAESILKDKKKVLPCAAISKASTASTACSWACR